MDTAIDKIKESLKKLECDSPIKCELLKAPLREKMERFTVTIEFEDNDYFNFENDQKILLSILNFHLEDAIILQYNLDNKHINAGKFLAFEVINQEILWPLIYQLINSVTYGKNTILDIKTNQSEIIVKLGIHNLRSVILFTTDGDFNRSKLDL